MVRSAGLLTALSLLMFACCGDSGMDEPPESFRLVVRFSSIDVAVVDALRLRFAPPDGASFEPIPDTVLEDGEIRLGTEGDSVVVLIDGEHIRRHATNPGDGSTHYVIQLWSEDPVMRTAAPLVLGSAIRDGAAIGSGTAYLPEWPPPMEVGGECQGRVCTTELRVTCTGEANAAGLCTP